MRPFVSSAVFARFGYRIADVVTIPDTIIAALPKGAPIAGGSPADADLLHGVFCRTAEGGVYYAEYGVLRPIADEATYRVMKGEQGRTLSIAAGELARLPIGKALRIPPQL